MQYEYPFGTRYGMHMRIARIFVQMSDSQLRVVGRTSNSFFAAAEQEHVSYLLRKT